MLRRPNMLAVAALMALTVQPPPGFLDVWRERLVTWADAALRYVQQHGGSHEQEGPFRVVAFNLRNPGDWYEARLLEIAAFLHREMMAFHAFADQETTLIVKTESGWRSWPMPARGEHDEGDGIR